MSTINVRPPGIEAFCSLREKGMSGFHHGCPSSLSARATWWGQECSFLNIVDSVRAKFLQEKPITMWAPPH